MLNPAAGFVGEVLRGLFRAILFVRRPRPIHSRGRVLRGDISWIAGAAPSGIRWIDERPVHPVPVVARLSRSVGLPAALPDIIGLALRTDAAGRTVDIELASTGLGIPSRYLLLPHRSPSHARYGSLLPYWSPRGPILVCARPLTPSEPLPAGGRALDEALVREPWRLRLYHATPTGKWHPFAQVSVRLDENQDDTGLRFDSVRHALPGADTYPWVRALRQPSYHLAQDAPVRQRRG
ncbi:hypothetical protein ACLQ2Q_07630 [Microbacterium sp. DT81.1]|uniref:hypothetical protein n=1 Tax=Microbacterium sp. DT81.1 TaxID=3393413 RepID=UPI003CF11E37